MLTMDDLDLTGKTVLIREDFNVPFKLINGTRTITNTTRIDKALPTIKQALNKGAKVILMSHMGRPKGVDKNYSLDIVAKDLANKLDLTVPLFELDDLLADLTQFDKICLLENLRFLPGETDNNHLLSKKLASLADYVIMDAFAVSHRKNASTFGVVEYAKQAVLGPLLKQELLTISDIINSPKPPVAAIIGGSKVSTKLDLLASLLAKTDLLVVGGGIANTFLKACGYNVGKSLVEDSMVKTCKQLLSQAYVSHKQIWLPIDVVVSDKLEGGAVEIKHLDQISSQDMILDIGPKSVEYLARVLQDKQTILWNGPLGVFENPDFAKGTQGLAKIIADSKATSLAGGGDTIAAIDEFIARDQITYISTGGGAFLSMLEGKTLPMVEALMNKESAKNTANTD